MKDKHGLQLCKKSHKHALFLMVSRGRLIRSQWAQISMSVCTVFILQIMIPIRLKKEERAVSWPDRHRLPIMSPRRRRHKWLCSRLHRIMLHWPHVSFMYGLCLFIKNMDSKRVLCEILQDVGKYVEQGGFDGLSKEQSTLSWVRNPGANVDWMLAKRTALNFHVGSFNCGCDFMTSVAICTGD